MTLSVCICRLLSSFVLHKLSNVHSGWMTYILCLIRSYVLRDMQASLVSIMLDSVFSCNICFSCIYNKSKNDQYVHKI